MNPLIIIPTYVSARSRAKSSIPVATYDHATPLGQPGELPRLLDSLTQVRNLGPVCVLVASERSCEVQALQQVQSICSGYPQMDLIVVGGPELSLVRQRFEQLNLGPNAAAVALTGYSAVRNLGLVVANVFGFDSVIFLDDDEVIDDPDFLEKGCYGLGKLTKRGIPILAKTGYYLNAEGTYHSMSQNRWYNHWWQQGRTFNEWIDKAMSGPRLSRSNHVCGGCLALHHEAFKRVCFDPWVVRGEDLDYMLNLRMYGSDIWFDNRWMLHHLPPASASEGLRFRQDVFRWLYEYRKMEYSRTQIDLQQVKPSSLEPYPGPFLEPGIDKRIKRTARLRSLGRPDRAAYRDAAKAANNEASTYAARNCAKYFEFQFVWPEIMARTENDAILRTALLQSAALRDSSLRGAPGTAEAEAAAAFGLSARVASPEDGEPWQEGAEGAATEQTAERAPWGSGHSGFDAGSTTEIRLNSTE